MRRRTTFLQMVDNGTFITQMPDALSALRRNLPPIMSEIARLQHFLIGIFASAREQAILSPFYKCDSRWQHNKIDIHQPGVSER